MRAGPGRASSIAVASTEGPSRVALIVAVVACLALGLLGLRPAPAAADPSARPLVTGWIPSWATPTGQASVEGNADLVGETSPFWYSAKAQSGSVTISPSADAATMATVLASLRARSIAVIPSVADGSSARAMAAILTDDAARANHVNQLVGLVIGNGYDGIELDYEKFAFSDGKATWPTTRPAWVRFVAELGNALHGNGKKLALAVPVMYDGTYSSSSGYWVYDYAGIAPYVDSLRIMTYDYSVSRPGPIAPLSFLDRTLRYAVSVVPASRIRMGVPAYGRLWTARRPDGTPSITGTCPASGVPATTSFTTAAALGYLTTTAGAPPTVTFDPTTGESVATFSKQYAGPDATGVPTTCTVDHVAWWVDARGMAARLPLVGGYGLAGIAVWHLGGMDADSWAAIRSYAQTWTPPATTAVSAVPSSPPATAATLSVKASTLRPKPGKKVTLKVTVRPKKKGVTVKRQMLVRGSWRTVATKRTTAAGKATFTVKWPKKRTTHTYRFVTTKKGALAAGASGRFTIRTRR